MNPIIWLSERWRSSGISHGDVVLLHSDVLRTLSLMNKNGYSPSASLILDSFLDLLGVDGTLILPLFNFEFTSGKTFHFNKSPSHMGVISELARNRQEVVRTGHPIYSFAVLGKYSDRFEGLNNFSAFGKDSPFGLLRQLNGKIAVLDLEEQESMTFHHHVEEMNIVPYRYFKEFSGSYVDGFGETSKRTYSMYVRRIDKGILTKLNPLGELLWSNQIYFGCRPRVGTGLRVADANKVFEFVSTIINQVKAYGNLYEKVERNCK